MRPSLDPCFRFPIRIVLFGWDLQARAAWQWANYWAALCPTNKTVCYLNIDETSVKMFPQTSPRGFVALANGETTKLVLDRERSAPLSTRRSAVSLVGCVADCADVQAVLPQVVVASSKVLPAAVAASHQCRSDNVFVVRRRSAWVDANCFRNIVRLLGVSLRDLHSKYFFILLFDANPAHLGSATLRSCREEGLHVVLVPAGMTPSLQPLDTHVFSIFKRRYFQSLETRLLSIGADSLQVASILDCICDTAREVISSGCWSSAFASCGFGCSQRQLSQTVRHRLGFGNDEPLVACDLPALGQLQVCFPKRMQVPITVLFMGHRAWPLPSSSRPAWEPLPPWIRTLRLRPLPRAPLAQPPTVSPPA
jgi:hypothetical protein